MKMGEFLTYRPAGGLWSPARHELAPGVQAHQLTEWLPDGVPYTPAGADVPVQPEYAIFMLRQNEQIVIAACRKYWHGGINSGHWVEDWKILYPPEEVL